MWACTGKPSLARALSRSIIFWKTVGRGAFKVAVGQLFPAAKSKIHQIPAMFSAAQLLFI
jgi:hypothetical protein